MVIYLSEMQTLLFPWFVALVLGIPIVGGGMIIARYERTRRRIPAKPQSGRRARPSLINGTSTLHEETGHPERQLDSTTSPLVL